MPGKKARKNHAPPSAPGPLTDSEAECAMQFRRIGDMLNFRQKILNLIAKLFHLGT
ncbi:phorbol-12-myristate-13-acetate-induced protein 1 [Suncus etruscus]|uniref:phorbol-12-myristate-13-acetate-induced protein 1 n=1 Tax=Suncus etruscus TaxID=109475 RepID=UPI0021107E77|nr:phorbol-12-myristate-13-acetate-induced protein 1 [Suncus etruscus]